MLHYELTDESKINSHGVRLFRIRATRDLPRQRVKAGDLGGWLESAYAPDGRARLSDEAWVSFEAELFGNATATGRARIKSYAKVYENATISGNAVVVGSAEVCGMAVITDNAEIREQAKVSGSAAVFGSALVGWNVAVTGTARVHGDGVVSDDGLIVGDDADIFRYDHVSSFDTSVAEIFLVRTTAGHQIQMESWTSTIDELASHLSGTETDDVIDEVIAEFQSVIVGWEVPEEETTVPTKESSCELTTESRIYRGETVYRIRAVRDIPAFGVRMGDSGGWVTSTHLADGSPRISGDSWLGADATLTGEARLTDFALVDGSAEIGGTVLVAGGHVTDNVRLGGDLRVGPKARIDGSLRLTASGIINCYLNSNGFVFNVPHPIEITREQHLVTLSPVGSYGSTVSIVRMKNGEPYICHWPNSWVGTPEKMRKEAEDIVDLTCDRYIDHGEAKFLWAQHYRHIATFAETLPEMWDC